MTSILKTCTKCKCEKPTDEFPRNKNKKNGRESQCKACARARANKHYRDNHDEKVTYAREYRQKNPEKVYLVKRRWRKENADREYNRVSTWKRENQPKVRAYIHHRRAEKRGGGSFTAAEFKALCNHYGNKCLCCGRDDVKLTPDHVIPIVKGGSNNISNIQPLCLTCNLEKGTKTTDYRPGKFIRWIQSKLF